MKPPWTSIAAIAEMTPAARDAVDLVLLDLDSADLDIAAVNDRAERERADRFVFPRDARRFAVAHGFLRRLLARRLDCDPATLAFGQGPQGKPFLATPGLSNLAFNLSHSAGAGLIALGDIDALGVDIEEERPLDDLAELAAQTFAPAEAASLLARPQDGRLESFFCCWTRKEAVIKLWGQGLSADLKSFEVSTDPDVMEERLAISRPHIGLNSIDLRSFRPRAGFHAALAAPADVARDIRLWRLVS